MPYFSRPILLASEFLVLLVAAPLVMAFTMPMRYLLPAIWIAALYARFVSPKVSPRDRTPVFTRAILTPILARFAISAVLMGALTYALKPELLFSFIAQKPVFWLLVMVLYPLLSVIPQEFIYRRFFFQRYASLFTDTRVMLLMSAVAFAFAHILFQNWVAPTLCLIGGWMFAQTYAKHRSLVLVVFEHALYGDFLFTLGLGRYFFHGTVAAALN